MDGAQTAVETHVRSCQPPAGPTSTKLHEIHATGRDVHRIRDLFALSITAALRYTAVLEHPDPAADSDQGSGTPGRRWGHHGPRSPGFGAAQPSGFLNPPALARSWALVSNTRCSAPDNTVWTL